MKHTADKRKEKIVVELIKKNYAIEVKDISAHMKISDSELNFILKSLEAKGIIEIDRYANSSIVRALPYKVKVGKDKYSTIYM